MARPRRPGKRRQAVLSGLGLVELVTGPGPLRRTWHFPDDTARRAAWRAHREAVLSKVTHRYIHRTDDQRRAAADRMDALYGAAITVGDAEDAAR